MFPIRKIELFFFIWFLAICLETCTARRRKTVTENSNSPKTTTGKTSGRSYRSGRYLFPFAVINFPPEPCSPSNTQQTDGVCLSKTRCVASGGEATGACQQGLGTCCKFIKQCSSNRRSISVFETVENLMSSSVSGSCEFVFPKQPGICQVRLDFVNVILQEAYTRGPNAGNCQTESLVVSGSANLNGPLKTCGRLTGQHMILSYGAASDLISVILHSEMLSAVYHIRATQIPCNSPYKAPDDCLQYFYSTSAAIKSFGFPRQLNNQRYTICVKPTSGGSFISWDKCQDMDADGVMHRDRFNVSEPAQPTKCLTDWIAIDAEKRCGQEFLPMTTGLGSHSRIRVNFDENETGNDIFTVPVPSDQLANAQQFCEAIAISNPVFFQGDPLEKLCQHMNLNSQNICMCKFSNNADMKAQAFALDIQITQPGLYMCPKILGYTEKFDVTDNKCKYIANVRTTDRDNTGFCIRYQAM